MPTEQTNSQRRFTVIELPVFPIVKESLLLPFNYMPELVKFGKMPFLLILAVDLLCYGLERQDISKSLTGTLMMVAHFVLFTPFSVAWTKLAIHGRRSCRRTIRHSPTRRTQWMYLLATTVMILALLILSRGPLRPATLFPAKF